MSENKILLGKDVVFNETSFVHDEDDWFWFKCNEEHNGNNKHEKDKSLSEKLDEDNHNSPENKNNCKHRKIKKKNLKFKQGYVKVNAIKNLHFG